jgi:glutamine amidotransferase
VPAVNLAILNYGLANLRSVQRAFERVDVPARIITTPDEIDDTDHLVLPGVGAVADAIAHIRSASLDEPIRRHITRGRPFLGICLGLQMLFDTCYEGGAHQGLGVVAGDCVRFDVDTRLGLKVPHMGWNSLNIRSINNRTPTLLDTLPASPHVYFVHSYHVRPTDASIIAATTTYGEPFVSAIQRDNLFAVQFHPEKSQAVGRQILARFAGVKC